jgi:hypothetical protein
VMVISLSGHCENWCVGRTVRLQVRERSSTELSPNVSIASTESGYL